MKILGIETSAVVASVALLEGDEKSAKLLAEYTINNKLNHSVNLMPMLEAMVAQVSLSLDQLDYVAIASGPGSFTGLRIGSATAKGLAHGLDLPIIEVPTLEAMAYHVPLFDGYIIPMMDARRSQVFTGIYQIVDGVVRNVVEDTVLPFDELASVVKTLEDKPCYLLGDGVVPSQELIKTHFTEIDYFIAPPHLRDQKAGSVCMAAYEKALKGESVHYSKHAPNYIRMSQAERELKERNSAKTS